jgi:hypothetical protein
MLLLSADGALQHSIPVPNFIVPKVLKLIFIHEEPAKLIDISELMDLQRSKASHPRLVVAIAEVISPSEIRRNCTVQVLKPLF